MHFEKCTSEEIIVLVTLVSQLEYLQENGPRPTNASGSWRYLIVEINIYPININIFFCENFKFMLLNSLYIILVYDVFMWHELFHDNIRLNII